MPAGMLLELIHLCSRTLSALGSGISSTQVESLALTVHTAMTLHARSFHTLEHVFGLAEGSNPVQSLAALYHDVVYYQVDEGFTPEIDAILAPYIRVSGAGLMVTPELQSAEAALALTLAVFGYRLGTSLPASGQNEFLSALLMNRQLEGIVASKLLLKATACIEATIPFRGRNEQGETPAELLERRLCTTSEQPDLQLSVAEAREAVQWAVDFANRDVASFGEEDPARFLDNTWLLLPETNPSLRLKGAYSITSYRRALQKMRASLGALDPACIYASHHGVPSAERHRALSAAAARNVAIGRAYLDVKLLAVAILEALADLTGGEASVALFTGGLEGETGEAGRLEDYLLGSPVSPAADTSSVLYRLLAAGRASSTSFDLRHSPLALFLYGRLDAACAGALLSAAYRFFEGALSAREFLDLGPPQLIAEIAEATSNLAMSRRDALREFAALKRAQT